jgi:glucose-6-phosphate 1-epimerase
MNATSELDELDRRFGIPGIARVCEGRGGLLRVQITSPHCEGEMYLHGAHVTSWKPVGHDEILFLSSKSHWQDGQAIRGGIPICFPWFRAKTDDPKAPAHGFVRTKSWQLESIVQQEEGIVVTMFTESDHETHRWWPADFHLVYRVTFGSELRLRLACTNTGSEALRFEEALHTYNGVAEIASVRLHGLDTAHFLDNTDSNREKSQLGDVAITSQTDNAFMNTQNAVEVRDPKLRRQIRLEKDGSNTTVVWNPWREGAAGLRDLGEGEWTQFLCVEASNILADAASLAPGAQHKITAVLSVSKL